MTNAHTCQNIVVTCIDFRFQEYIDSWIHQNLKVGDFDRVEFAGGVYDSELIMKQIGISSRLHNIKKVYLMNHEDCGAYGDQGTYERHVQDLSNMRKNIATLYPDLSVETYFIHLDGTFEATA